MLGDTRRTLLGDRSFSDQTATSATVVVRSTGRGHDGRQVQPVGEHVVD